jgi:type IV pilus assembly protein PilB
VSITDIDRALASLCLDYHLMTPDRAMSLIELAKGDAPRLAELIHTEIPEAALLGAIAEELGFEYADLYGANSGLRTNQELIERADYDLLRHYSALPCVDEKGEIAVAVANPGDRDLRNYLEERYPGMRMVLGSASQIQSQLSTINATARHSLAPELLGAVVPDNLVAQPALPASPLQAWVDSVLDNAVAQNASDVHFEFNSDGSILLRFRIDGILRVQVPPPRGRELDVVGILMVRADMDSSDKRQPQDGTFSFKSVNRQIDIRAAMLPQENGTSIVLRILDSANISRRLSDMGFETGVLASLEAAARSSQGTIIVCGPTGSGKTTTLYALMRDVASIEKNIITIEDPVEYRLPLINQTAVNHIGDRSMSFARSLRAILRMDPDVILVGEVRDQETARTAMDAAVTGHLVLSTIHARDAVGIYTRLSEMGVPLYLISEAMSLGVSQRLVRRLHDCSLPAPPSELQRQLFVALGDEPPETVRVPTGCSGCGNTGFRGRIAVAELLAPTPAFRQKVLAGVGHDELLDQARADGMVPMKEAGLVLVRQQVTTIEELSRVVAY